MPGKWVTGYSDSRTEREITKYVFYEDEEEGLGADGTGNCMTGY
jgi:hypothetical protein